MESQHQISVETAKAYTKRYRDALPKLLAAEYQGRNTLFEHSTFDRSAFDAIIAQPNCAQVRMYFGLNDQNQITSIFIGLDENGKELTAIIMDDGRKCPPHCDPPPGTLQS